MYVIGLAPEQRTQSCTRPGARDTAIKQGKAHIRATFPKYFKSAHHLAFFLLPPHNTFHSPFYAVGPRRTL